MGQSTWGPLIQTSHIMQYAVVFVAFLALANGQFTCDECKKGVASLGQYLQTPNEIAAVEQALSDLVCPTLPEDKIEACIDFVYFNWEAMATALFAYENTLTDICGDWDIAPNSKGPLELESHVLIATLKWLNLLVFWLTQPLLLESKTILLDPLIVNLPTT